MKFKATTITAIGKRLRQQRSINNKEKSAIMIIAGGSLVSIAVRFILIAIALSVPVTAARADASCEEATPGQVEQLQKSVKGKAPGGIVFGSNGTQSIPIINVKYDPKSNTFTTTNWAYRPKISPSETVDLLRAIQVNDTIVMDVSVTGNAVAEGLARSSRVAQRMIVADIILGDITKGFGYITPLYKLAGGYQPAPYTTIRGATRYAEIYAFTPYPFVVKDSRLTSPGTKVTGYNVPVVVQSDGTRKFDMASATAGAKDPAIKQNMLHIFSNISYYSRERVIRDMFDYAEVAEFGRLLKQNRVDIGSISNPSP